MMTKNRKILQQLLVSVIISLSMNVVAYEKLNMPGQQGSDVMISGKVTETVDVSGYTYVEVDTGKQRVWAAGPVSKLKKGERISFSSAMPVENYHSKSLQKDFSLIYFVGGYYSDSGNSIGTDTEMASPHDGMKQKPATGKIKGIDKLKDGQSIAEIYQQKSSLKNNKVRVRGKVTKFSPEIMGKNWVHIRDSSSEEDLTLTSKDVVKVGDIIIVEGKLELEKDYGYGYVYPVILEGARVLK